MMKLGIAVSTYVNSPCPEQQSRLIHTLTTLLDSGFRGRVIVVDDGSSFRDWNLLFNSVPIDRLTIIRKSSNGGISRAKNTCIQSLLSADVDIGFLADDDISFSRNWWKRYIRAHVCTGLPHFSFATPHLRDGVVEIADYEVMKCSGLNGVLLSFTPGLIKKIGGFAVSEVKWGHDHVNWTNRIVRARLIPYYVDVVHSDERICLGPYSKFSPVSIDQRRLNRNYDFPEGDIYQPILE